MKYTREMPPPSQRDHADKPRGPSPLFRDILGGLFFLAAVGFNVYLMMGLPL